MVTDENGIFRFDNINQGDYLLKVLYIGLENKLLPVRVATEPVAVSDIQLKESNVLSEVVVTAPPKIFKMENSGISTNIQNSRLKNIGTAADILAQLPFVIKNGENFTVFGKGTPLIYINNRLVRDVSELNEINSANLKKVTVITNPGAEYDATVKSVIKIETLRPQGEGISGTATGNIFIDRNFSHNELINLNYRKNNLDIFGMFRFSQANDRNYDYLKQSTNFNEPVLTRLNLEATQHSRSIRSNLGFNYLFGKDNSFGVKYELTRNPDDHGKPHTQIDVYQNNQLTEIITSDWDSHEKHSTNYVNAYLNIHPVSWLLAKLDMDYATGTGSDSQNVMNNFTDSIENIITNADQNYNLYAAKLTMTTSVNTGKLTYGGEYSDTRNQQNFYVNDEGIAQNLIPDNNTSKQNLFAAFASFSKPFGRLTADIGLRYENTNFEYLVNGIKQDDQSQIYRNWFPSAGLSYSDEKYSISLNYRNTIYRPAYYQLRNSVQYDSPYSYESGNPYLKPVNINTLSLLCMWKDVKLMANYDLYKNNILFIPEQYLNNIVLFSPVNLDKNQNLSTSISYSPTIRVWKPILEAGITKDFLVYNKTSYNKPRYSFSMRNSIMLFKSWQVSADLTYSTNGNETIDYAYEIFRMNVNLSKSFLKDKLRVNLYGTDIFNTDKQKADVVVNNIISSIHHDYNTQGIRLSVTYRFNSTSSKYKGEAASGELNRL